MGTTVSTKKKPLSKQQKVAHALISTGKPFTQKQLMKISHHTCGEAIAATVSQLNAQSVRANKGKRFKSFKGADGKVRYQVI